MSLVLQTDGRDVRPYQNSNVAVPERSSFLPLTDDDLRKAFAVPAVIPPILSLGEAADLVKLAPQTLKRKVSEGLYGKSVVRGKPLRFWRDRLVAEVMR
jgi:hypothetical protein